VIYFKQGLSWQPKGEVFLIFADRLNERWNSPEIPATGKATESLDPSVLIDIVNAAVQSFAYFWGIEAIDLP
jgi:hypothetical protein